MTVKDWILTALLAVALGLGIGWYSYAGHANAEISSLTLKLSKAEAEIKTKDGEIATLRNSLKTQNEAVDELKQKKADLELELAEAKGKINQRKETTKKDVDKIGTETAKITTSEQAVSYLRSKAAELAGDWK